MQERRTQAQRRAETRRLLISAARHVFAEKGYAAAGTPEIVDAAGVTRGALYHHFEDKQALFRAVVEEEHLLLAMNINAATGSDEETGPVKALVAGSDAFLQAMKDDGRRRILLVDAPAVLGREELDAIDARNGRATLLEGLRQAMDAEAIRRLPLAPLAHLFSAMFDRAALAPAEEAADYAKAIKALIRGLKI